jgi:hypothetical protein
MSNNCVTTTNNCVTTTNSLRQKTKTTGKGTRTPATKLPFHFSFLYSETGSHSVRKQHGRKMLYNILGRLY